MEGRGGGGLRRTLVMAAGLYVAFLVYLVWCLRFNMFQSDVLSYWKESQQWRTPFSTWWVPGYPLLIALARRLTTDSLPPIVLMWVLAGIGYLLATSAVYQLAVVLGQAGARVAALLFAVYPFVGLSYSVYPIADIWAIALLLQAVLRLERHQSIRFMFATSLVLIVHKAAWFFVPPLLLVACLERPRLRIFVPLACLPLALWIVAGAFHHHDALWFMRWGVDNLVKSKDGLPVLDGLIGPFFSPSPVKWAKGVVVATTVAVAVFVGWRCYLQRSWPGVCIAGSIVLMCVVINSYEIWAVVRFSKMLIVPITFVFAGTDRTVWLLRRQWLVLGVLVACLISNMAYGFYLTRFFSD